MEGSTRGSLLGSLLLLITDFSLRVGLFTLDFIDFIKDLSFLNFDDFCCPYCPILFVLLWTNDN